MLPELKFNMYEFNKSINIVQTFPCFMQINLVNCISEQTVPILMAFGLMSNTNIPHPALKTKESSTINTPKSRQETLICARKKCKWAKNV